MRILVPVPGKGTGSITSRDDTEASNAKPFPSSDISLMQSAGTIWKGFFHGKDLSSFLGWSTDRHGLAKGIRIRRRPSLTWPKQSFLPSVGSPLPASAEYFVSIGKEGKDTPGQGSRKK